MTPETHPTDAGSRIRAKYHRQAAIVYGNRAKRAAAISLTFALIAFTFATLNLLGVFK